MSKSRRGNPLRKEGFTRGTCPVSGRSGVKLLYDHTDESGNAIKISKVAFAKFKNIQAAEASKKKSEEAALAVKAASEEKKTDEQATAVASETQDSAAPEVQDTTDASAADAPTDEEKPAEEEKS